MNLDPEEWSSDRKHQRTEIDHLLETIIGAAVVGFFVWYFDFWGMVVAFDQWLL